MANEISSQGRVTLTNTAAGVLTRNTGRHGFIVRVHPSSSVSAHLRWHTASDTTEVTTSNSSIFLQAGEQYSAEGEVPAGALRVIATAAGGGGSDLLFYQEW